MNELFNALSNHPGFAKKKGKAPVDCHTYTKRFLRMNFEAATYRQIHDDPYRDGYVLPDLYVSGMEEELLEGAMVVAQDDFYEHGGRETLDVLMALLNVDIGEVQSSWMKFRENGHYTYSGYQYVECIETENSKILAVQTNGKIKRISAIQILQ